MSQHWLPSLWRILTPAQRRWVALAQFASLLMAFSTVAGIASISPFFAVLSDPNIIDRSAPLSWLYSHFAFHSKHFFVVALGVAFIVMAFISNLINMLGSYLLTRIALTIGDDLKALLYKEYLHRALLYHVGRNSTSLLTNVVYEATRGPIVMLQCFFRVVTAAFTAGLIVVSILFVNPPVAGAVIAILGGGYTLVYLAIRQRILRSARHERQLISDQMKLVAETFGAIKEVILLRKQQYFERRFQTSCRSLSRLAAYNDAVTNSPKQVMECVAVGTLVAACLVLNDSDNGGGKWLAQLTFLGFAIYRLLPALQQAFTSIVKLRAAKAAFEMIAPDLLRGRSAHSQAEPSGVGLARYPHHEIRLTNVYLTYPASKSPALEDVSMCIPAGSVVGIVGANGSGKTTLVDVLAGLLVPSSGTIAIDGVALEKIGYRTWHSLVAYVQQNIALLDSTISENIAFGVDAAEVDIERMHRAAQIARLEAYVAALPNGYDELVGEQGLRLSGGQRQRIGIARALYRDSSVLIMDEATSAQDVVAESEIMDTIDTIRGSRTIFLIAHRQNMLKKCDWIVHLDGGRLCSIEKVTAAASSPALSATAGGAFGS